MTLNERQLHLRDYLEHMIEASRLAKSYVEGLSKESFLQDRKTQQAVVLNLITIGAGRMRAAEVRQDIKATALVRR